MRSLAQEMNILIEDIRFEVMMAENGGVCTRIRQRAGCEGEGRRSDGDDQEGMTVLRMKILLKRQTELSETEGDGGGKKGAGGVVEGALGFCGGG